MFDLDKIGMRLERRGKALEEIKPMSIRRFSWELNKLILKVAAGAALVAWVAHH